MNLEERALLSVTTLGHTLGHICIEPGQDRRDVVVHPIVLLGVVDHYNRAAAFVCVTLQAT